MKQVCALFGCCLIVLCTSISVALADENASTSSTLIVHCGAPAATAAPGQPSARAVAPTPIATPEPSTFALIGIGLAGLAARTWAQRSQK